MQFKFNPHAAVFLPVNKEKVLSLTDDLPLASALKLEDATANAYPLANKEDKPGARAGRGRRVPVTASNRDACVDSQQTATSHAQQNLEEGHARLVGPDIPGVSPAAHQVEEAKAPNVVAPVSAWQRPLATQGIDIPRKDRGGDKVLQPTAPIEEPAAASEQVNNVASSWARAAGTAWTGAAADATDLPAILHRPVGPGDFQAVREIGEGAFGKVYLVKSRITNRHYAMKVLSKQTVLRKEQVAYAMSERDVMSSLEHPYLVSLRFSFQTPHRLFLVMDYLEGGHLWLHMKSGFFSEAVARVFTAEIVLAIGHLHSLNIAHRDLKPENILLDSANHLRLTDFGLAKKAMDDSSRAHTMVGTIDYMAPEVVKNEGHGKSVDWWSLGVLLYEMLYAELPFAPVAKRVGDKKVKKLDPSNEAYKEEVKRRIQHGKVTWPKGRFVNPVSKAGKDLIHKLLTKCPAERLGANGVDEVMAHPFFKGVDWKGLMARTVPSPLACSIFSGAPDKIGKACVDPVPHPHDERPCPKLAGYLFENDTPPGSPRGDSNLVELFRGFSYAESSEFSRMQGAEGAHDDPFVSF